MGFLAVTSSGGEAVGAVLLLFAISLPVLSFVITKKLLLDGESNGTLVMEANDSELYVYKKAWRDRDLKNGRKSSNYPKSWRKSTYVNRFGAVFYHLKQSVCIRYNSACTKFY